MKKKSVGIFMLVIIIGVAGYVLFPHISSMGESSKKRNLVRSAKTYGDEVKTLWNSDAVYCDPGGGMKSLVAVPDGDYYIILGNKKKDSGLPVFALEKIDNKYYGYIHVTLTQRIPTYNVILTDGKYTVKSNKNYSLLNMDVVSDDKIDFSYDNTYHYCQVDAS